MVKEPPLLADLPEKLFRVGPELQRFSALGIPRFRTLLRRLVETFDGWKTREQEEALKNVLAGGNDYPGVSSFLGRLTGEELSAHFSVEEMAAIDFSSVYLLSESVGKEMERLVLPAILEKLKLSAWHNGYGKLGWNWAAEAYEAMRRFTLADPDFTYHFDASVGSNNRGYSRYTRTFLDGEVAILIFYRGKHALTLSFDIRRNQRRPAQRPQIFLRQIQLKEPKGNRFLYRLKPGYVEAVTAAFVRAFGAFDVHLIHGDAAVQAIVDSLQAEINVLQRSSRAEAKKDLADLLDHRDKVTTEVAHRLRRIYDSPFRGLCRRTRRLDGYSRVRLVS